MRNMKSGIIVKGVGGLYTVRTDEDLVECKARGLFRKEKITPFVGDNVNLEDGVISGILPRKNFLSRPPCANIDKLFIVCAVALPDPNTYNIDRMTVIARYFDIEPILIFNKIDLEDKLKVRDIYLPLPMKTYEICAAFPDTEVLDAIKEEIKGNTVALCGVSGVGKSTFMNLLDSNAAAETGSISSKLGRGKNTTRHTELFETCGGRVMDTPGFSSIDFETFGIKDRSRLADCFDEFAPYIEEGCRFSDCKHIAEPGCNVREAVERGEISSSRYESFVKMYEEIGPLKEWENK